MKLFNLLLITLLLSPTLSAKPESEWKAYYKNTLNKPPSPFVVKVAKAFEGESTKVALDLGAGAGNDTAYLLQKGWTVIAVDEQPLSKKTTMGRKDIKSDLKKNLTFIQKRYGQVDWLKVPKVDMIVASHSLLTLDNKKYKSIWKDITSRLKPTGVFVGNFFGVNQGEFQSTKREEMLLLSMDEVRDLFRGFSFSYYKEIEKDHQTPSGEKFHYHAFSIVAEKKA